RVSHRRAPRPGRFSPHRDLSAVSEPSTVVVTGAFGALGGAVARRFASRGVRLGLLGRGPGPPGAGAGWAPRPCGSRGVRLGLLGRGPVPAALRQEFGAAHVLLGGVD